MSKSPVTKYNFELPADGWYQLESKGDHLNKATGIVQVIDEQAIRDIVLNFNRDAAAGKLAQGHEMLIDRDHFKYDLDKETTAYGWLTKLEGRPDGYYGKINWTGVGERAVKGGDYRFFSSEYDEKDCKILNDGTPRRVRPTKLDGMSLSNNFNNKGQRPITNREVPQNGSGKASPAILNDVAAEQARHDRIKEPIVKWFQAVKQVKDSARNHLGTGEAGNITFSHAWNLAKVHYPAEYAAAHGLVNETASADDSADVQLAGQQLTEITNRISAMSGCSLISAYDLARSEFPRLLNRLTPHSTRILNREKQSAKPELLQKAAGKIINRMIAEGMAASGHPHSVVFSRVMATELIMGQFAAGQINAGTVLTDHPELWERLVNEA